MILNSANFGYEYFLNDLEKHSKYVTLEAMFFNTPEENEIDPTEFGLSKITPEKGPESQKKEAALLAKFIEIQQSIYDWFRNTGEKIPDWLPIIKPLFDTAANQMRSSAIFQGVDLETGKKLTTLKEKLGTFAQSEFKLLFAKGRFAIDFLLLVGTGGGGTVAEAGVAAGVKAGAEATGEALLKNKLLNLIKNLATNKEGAAIDLVISGLKTITTELSTKPETAKALMELTKLFELIGKNEIARPIVIAWLKKQPWWQQLMGEVKDQEGRLAYRDKVWKIQQQPA